MVSAANGSRSSLEARVLEKLDHLETALVTEFRRRANPEEQRKHEYREAFRALDLEPPHQPGLYWLNVEGHREDLAQWRVYCVGRR